MSTIRANTLTDAAGNNSSTAAQIQQGRAKAWFNLNGTGTIAERDSFNTASHVDNGLGDYTSNFTAALPNANYALSATCKVAEDANGPGGNCAALARAIGVFPTTAQFRFVHGIAGVANDPPVMTVVTLGD